MTTPAPKKTTKRTTRKKPDQPVEIELPSRAGDTERDGKKSVGWREDPEILQRLAMVATLMNQNKPSWMIAKTLKISVATAKRDIKRVREIWAESSEEEVLAVRDLSVSQYQSIIDDAYNKMAQGKLSDRAIVGYMNVILRAQERIDKVKGIADPLELGGPNGGPIQVEDINAVREKRWQAIEDKLLKAAQAPVLPNKEPDVTTTVQPTTAGS